MIILPARRSQVKAKQIAHELSECRQPISKGLIKCRANDKPPYKILYFISVVIKRIFHTVKISLCTMYIIKTSFVEKGFNEYFLLYVYFSSEEDAKFKNRFSSYSKNPFLLSPVSPLGNSPKASLYCIRKNSKGQSSLVNS